MVGLWLAYGVIGLFLLVLTVVVVRTLVLYGSLVLMAATSLFSRDRTRRPGPRAAPPDDATRPAAADAE